MVPLTLAAFILVFLFRINRKYIFMNNIHQSWPFNMANWNLIKQKGTAPMCNAFKVLDFVVYIQYILYYKIMSLRISLVSSRVLYTYSLFICFYCYWVLCWYRRWRCLQLCCKQIGIGMEGSSQWCTCPNAAIIPQDILRMHIIGSRKYVL